MNAKASKQILMVEDSPTQAERLKFILERRGYQLRWARNGREALASLAEFKPDLVISDILMPEMNGYELCRQIRARAAIASIPVVLLTSLGDPEDIVKGLECGADNFITKPFDESYLLSRIEYIFVNQQFCRPESAGAAVEIFFAGRQHRITSNKLQILNLLFSAYETAIAQKKELIRTQAELQKLTGELERKVQERTAALSQEVAERARAEELAREQAMLLDEAHDAILVCDLNGGIRYWNRGAEELYGWTSPEAVGKTLADLLSKTNSPRLEEARKQTLAQGRWSGELMQFTRAGKIVIAESSWTLVKRADGEPKSMLVINTDLTEKKQIEAQFFRAQRMESIGILAGGIAHDLNNVLAPIMIVSQMLRLESEDAGSLKLLDTLDSAAQHGAELIKQILSFARGVEGEPVEIQIGHLIREVHKLLRETLPRSIQMQVSAPKDLWTLKGAATLLNQVLMNLCVNARDAMPEGGTLQIRAENVTLGEDLQQRHPDAKPGPHVAITVSDTGTGIPPELQERIFQPFFTTKGVGKGTGLGLSTVKGIVENHGGFIEVQSEPGAGTRFTFYLPAFAGAATEPADPKPSQLPRGQGERILVVDDEPAVLEMTRIMLERYGYSVVTAENGAEAVQLFGRERDHIRVVVTDIMMPVMDGMAAIKCLRQLDPDVQVILLGGLLEDTKLADLNQAGVIEVVAKPYSPEKLLHAVQRRLQRMQK